MDLIVNKKVIETPVIDILNQLRSELWELGIKKLKVIQNKGENARITCPKHKGGNEEHPSCSVLLVSKGDLPKGFVSCFTCHYAATLPQFISDCFNIEDNGEFGEEWLIERFNYSFLTELRPLKQLPLNREIKNDEVKLNSYVSEKELQSYRFYHSYMWKRKLTPEIVDKFDIGYDKRTNSITFPVYNNEGKCLFVIKRNVNIHYFQIPAGIEKEIFGMNQITSDINEVIICESVINALTCWVYGKPAIALFGTGTEAQINTLLKSNIRHFILGFDGDEAGHKATRKFRKALSKTKLVTEYRLPDGKDINDLSKEEFDNLKEY